MIFTQPYWVPTISGLYEMCSAGGGDSKLYWLRFPLDEDKVVGSTGALSDTAEREERALKSWHTLTLTFAGYEHGQAAVFSGTGSVQVTNPGNMVSPAIIEITPAVSVSQITLSGICRDSYTGADLPVTIKNLVTNKKVVIDGISGMITQDGAIKEVDAWALPSVPPGESIVTCDSNRMNIKVTIAPMIL